METKKENHRPCFEREDGQKVYIQAISLLELNKAEEGIRAEYKQRGEPIDPPKYTVRDAGGGETHLPMNESNLEVAGDPDETEKRFALWNAHQDALSRLKVEIGAVTSEIIFEGIICDPPSEAWIAKKKRRHIILPEDPEELLQYYKMTEILKTPGDLVKAQEEIILISSSGAVRREDIEAAGDTFRRQIQDITKRPSGKMADAGTDAGESPKEPLGS